MNLEVGNILALIVLSYLPLSFANQLSGISIIPPNMEEKNEIVMKSCQDDPDFSILINAFTNRRVPCSWIDDSNDVAEVLFRRQAQCWKASVGDACKRACGECCGDNESHLFTIQTSEDEEASVTCGWLAEDNTRRERYCSQKKFNCPYSCGYCGNNTVQNTLTPTGSPTTFETSSRNQNISKATTSPAHVSSYMIPLIVCGCFMITFLVRTFHRYQKNNRLSKQDKDYDSIKRSETDENQSGWCLPVFPTELCDCSWFPLGRQDVDDSTIISGDTTVIVPIRSIQEDSFYSEPSISGITETGTV